MSLANTPDKLQRADFTDPIRAFQIPGKGYCFGAGTALPTATDWAKGALFLLIDGDAGFNLYINEADDGYGTTPNWITQVT